MDSNEYLKCQVYFALCKGDLLSAILQSVRLGHFLANNIDNGDLVCLLEQDSINQLILIDFGWRDGLENNNNNNNSTSGR